MSSCISMIYMFPIWAWLLLHYHLCTCARLRPRPPRNPGTRLKTPPVAATATATATATENEEQAWNKTETETERGAAQRDYNLWERQVKSPSSRLAPAQTPDHRRRRRPVQAAIPLPKTRDRDWSQDGQASDDHTGRPAQSRILWPVQKVETRIPSPERPQRASTTDKPGSTNSSQRRSLI